MNSDKMTKAILLSVSFLILILASGMVYALVGVLYLHLKNLALDLFFQVNGILLRGKNNMEHSLL